MTAPDAAAWVALIAPIAFIWAVFAAYVRRVKASEATEAFTVEFIPERADVIDQVTAVDSAMLTALASREVTA